MTREEEIARLAEIEAMTYMSDEFKATYRAGEERRWMLEDAGVIDMMRWKVERMITMVNNLFPSGKK